MVRYLRVGGQFIYVLVFVLEISTVVSDSTKTKRGVKSVPQFLTRDAGVEGFLKQYGYMDQKPIGIQQDNSSPRNKAEELKRAIRKFQQFYGIPESGKLDELTLRNIAKPRCGTKDIERETRGRAKRFSRLAAKWKHHYLTWKVMKYTRQLSQSDQRETFRKAFQIWQDVAPLTFTETKRDADIEISFARGEHGDGAGNAFDGRSKVLAHAFGPGEAPISGDAHFDDDEQWTLNDKQGTSLLVVAAHEFGHSLGLGHSRDARALMYPAYQSQDNLKLGYDDIRGIQTIYGGKIRPDTRVKTVAPQPTQRPRPRVTPRPRPRVTPRPTIIASPSPVPGICSVQFDAIVRVDDDYYYGLKGSKVFKFSIGGLSSGFPKPITDIFPEAPSSVDVMFTKSDSSRFYIIKDLKVWRYTQFKLDTGYPKEIPPRHFREKPRFVMTFKDDSNYQRVLLFGSDFWWEYDFDNGQTFRPNVYSIGRFWKGVPRDVKYAVQYSDHYFYLVSESSYVVLSHHRREPVGESKRTGLPDWLSKTCADMISDSSRTNPSTYAVLLASLATGIVTFMMH